MHKHEEKKCSRCNNSFECRMGDITHCQCYGITLSTEERSFIEERYEDCLCSQCLLQLKQGYTFFREKYFFDASK